MNNNAKIDKEFEETLNLARDETLNELYETLEMDMEKVNEVKKKVLNLHPQSNEWIFISEIYKNKKGEFTVEELINEYYIDTISNAALIGIEYGKKFIVEDIQNKRFSLNDIKTMTEESIYEYLKENREEI